MRPSPPRPHGPLVGRSVELGRIEQAAKARERLVTLKGPGGMGKTRLALEAAPALAKDWLWCDVTYAQGEGDVWRALAEALGTDLRERAGLIAALRDLGRVVIVLDNFESVAADGQRIASDLLREVPEAMLLVASREALDVGGERVIELLPLEISSDAMTLFLQHAGRRDPPLHKTPENEAALLELLRAVDGIPLAIELAARRACVLGVEAVLAHLREGIDILSRPGSDRHASLERAIEESFRGLDDHERAAFEDAAVFRGGFGLDGARGVLEGDVPALLQSLADKSLLRLDEPGGRFFMHQVIRDFALDRGKGRRPSAEARHATFFIDWIDSVRPPAGVIPGRQHRERVLADEANVRAAAEHALRAGDAHGCVRALAGLAPTLRMYGESAWWSELREKTRPFDATLPPATLARVELVETLMVSLRGRRDEAEARAARLAADAADPEVRLAATILHVQQLLDRGDHDAAARAVENMCVIGEGQNHPALEAEWILTRLQTLDPRTPEAPPELDRAVAAARRLEDPTLLAATARVAAAFELARGDVPAARASLHQELEIAMRAELRPVLAQNALRLGCCDHLAGDLEAATARFEEAAERMRTLELRGRSPRAKLFLGLVWLERGDLSCARAMFEECESAASELHIAADAAVAAAGRTLVLGLAGEGPSPASPAAPSHAIAQIVSRLKAGVVAPEGLADPRLWASPTADIERAVGCMLRRTFAHGPPLRVETDADATFFATVTGRVDVSDRPSLRNVLRALLDARGAAIESAVLIAAGWPGERIREDAARNRLRVAIATLRKLGLEAIETDGSTYRMRAIVIRR